MRKKLNKEDRYIAYILNKKYDAPMTIIAKIMDVSQSTISNAIKQVKWEMEICDIKEKLKRAEEQIEKEKEKYEEPIRIIKLKKLMD